VIVHTTTNSILMGLPVLVIEELKKWFEAKGLRIDRNMLTVTEDCVATDDLRPSEMPDLMQDFNRRTAGVLSVIIGIITANVCGGSGMALLMSGPIGWLIGLVIGGVGAYLAARYGMEAARSRAETFHLPAWTLRFALKDKTIASARSKLRTQMHEQVLTELRKLESSLNQQIEETVAKEIQALTTLHHL
jgi:molecular chaperone DnaK